MFKKGDLVRIKSDVNMKSWDTNFVKWYNDNPNMTFVVKNKISYIKGYVWLINSSGPPMPSIFKDKIAFQIHFLELVPSNNTTIAKKKIDFLAINKEIAGG